MGDSVSGVGVLDKAVALLAALESGPCALAGLMERTGLPRATAHRLTVALESHGLVGRDGTARFVLGPRLAELARAGGGRSPTLAEAAAPVLAALRDETGESAQLYVPAAGNRVCVQSLESPHSLRTMVAIGAVLPMDRGSAGKVLRREAEAIRLGWAQSVEERERGVASVSAPVTIGADVVAAVSVSGPVERTTRRPGRLYAAAVVRAAAEIERAVSGIR